MGLPIHRQDAGEAQEAKELDWYQLYCQAIAAGIDPDEFGDYTYSQIFASIDAHKLRRYNDMHFNVSGIVSNMRDEDVKDALYGKNTGNPSRSKLIEKMMKPYSPSFLLPEVVEVDNAEPIEGLSPKTAEGIMQAIEQKLVTHRQWLAMRPIWQRVLATAKMYYQ